MNILKPGTLHALLCLLPFIVSAQQTHLDIKVPDRIEYDLFGPVKSIKTLYSKETFNKSYTESSQTEYKHVFDELGNQLIYSKKNITDDSSVRTEYSYDENGCLSGKTVNDSKKETNTVYRYTIDVDARQILRKNITSNSWRTTVYSSAGREHYIEDRNSSNTVTQTIDMKRRPDGKEYEFATCNGDGDPTKTSRFKWNANGLIREGYYHYHGTNECIYITRYTHPEKDEHGNWTKRVARTEMIYDGEKTPRSEKIGVREIEYFNE